jgi:hypothetical protein
MLTLETAVQLRQKVGKQGPVRQDHVRRPQVVIVHAVNEFEVYP